MNNLLKVAREVCTEDPKTRDSKFLWAFFIKFLNKCGCKCSIDLKPDMPSPESILRARRIILNTKNEFPEDFEPEPGVTYQKTNS